MTAGGHICRVRPLGLLLAGESFIACRLLGMQEKGLLFASRTEVVANLDQIVKVYRNVVVHVG